jgi:hypothetical protein
VWSQRKVKNKPSQYKQTGHSVVLGRVLTIIKAPLTFIPTLTKEKPIKVVSEARPRLRHLSRQEV